MSSGLKLSYEKIKPRINKKHVLTFVGSEFELIRSDSIAVWLDDVRPNNWTGRLTENFLLEDVIGKKHF